MRRIVVGVLQTNCWVIRSTGSRLALLVDPGDNAEMILDATQDLTIIAIVLTHAHVDHVLAAVEVAAAARAPVLAHPADAPAWPRELRHLHRLGHFDAGHGNDSTLGAERPHLAEWRARGC